MASIERTAYPHFKPSLTANELHTLYCPTDDERAFIGDYSIFAGFYYGLRGACIV